MYIYIFQCIINNENVHPTAAFSNLPEQGYTPRSTFILRQSNDYPTFCLPLLVKLF